ncbi:MAG: ABC transporter permease [Paracoccaceae bacterium]
MQATGLDPFPDRPAGKLSGGMKQRLSLCLAQIHNPDLLILDEPTTVADRLSRQQFWDLIYRIRMMRPGMSVIVATSTPDQVREQAGQPALEQAFIALLPETARQGRRDVVVPPRTHLDGPPDFGRMLMRDERAKVRIAIDAAMPFRAETARSYLQGLALSYMTDQTERRYGEVVATSGATVETRFRCNQAFKSVFAIVPSVILPMLVLIPAMMGVVREKETGFIANFLSTAVTLTEFVLGKQLPYVMIAFISILTLLVVAYGVFQVPIRGVWHGLSGEQSSICVGDDGVRGADLDIYQNPSCRQLCRRNHCYHSGGQFLGPADAIVLAVWWWLADLAGVSGVVVSADQRRHLYQRTAQPVGRSAC